MSVRIFFFGPALCAKAVGFMGKSQDTFPNVIPNIKAFGVWQ